jgi:hypothetical protein
MVGLKEFMFDLNWPYNIYGGDSGFFLKLEKDLITDMSI